MKRLTGALLCLLLAAFALPLAVLLAASLCGGDLIDFLRHGGEVTFSTGQYVRFFEDEDMLRRFGNSAAISGGVLLIQLPMALLGGLYLARCTWRSAHIMRFLLMLLLLLPFQSVMVPIFKLARWTLLYDKHLSVILLQGFSPLGMLIVWLLIASIPKEQWEAAQLDSKSQMRIFFRAVLPQIGPGLLVALLLCFAESWNLVEAPTILLPDVYLRPASITLNSTGARDGGCSYADAVMYSLPIAALYALVGQRIHRDDGALI